MSRLSLLSGLALSTLLVAACHIENVDIVEPAAVDASHRDVNGPVDDTGTLAADEETADGSGTPPNDESGPAEDGATPPAPDGDGLDAMNLDVIDGNAADGELADAALRDARSDRSVADTGRPDVDATAPDATRDAGDEGDADDDG